MRYLEDVRDGESLVGHYLCKQKQTLKSRAGKTYLSLKLQDKTAMVDAKVWELNHQVQSFEEGDFIKIDASVLTYQGEIQLNVKKIRKSQEGEFNPMDYIPCTDKDISTLYQQFIDYIKTVSNGYIKSLLENIFVKNNDIVEKFKKHSAAKAMHHNYMGGLLEHSLSVTQICDFMASRYKFVNRDILIASAMLHDIGKLWELSAFPDNEYTEDGQLIGHIVIGTELISEETAKIQDFPQTLKTLLKHCIIGHHGEFEFGSPQLPKTIEAFILHCADNSDAKIKMFEDALQKNNTQGHWTGYQKILSRNVRDSEF